MSIRTRVWAKSHNQWDRVSKHANACLLLKPVFNQNTTSCVQFMRYCTHNTQVTIRTASAQAHGKLHKTQVTFPWSPFYQTLWLTCMNQSRFSNSFAKLKHFKTSMSLQKPLPYWCFKNNTQECEGNKSCNNIVMKECLL